MVGFWEIEIFFKIFFVRVKLLWAKGVYIGQNGCYTQTKGK